MGAFVDITHFAANVYLPRRGRIERMGMELLTTPARLIQLTASEMRPVGVVPEGFVAHEHGGDLWFPLPVDGIEGLADFTRECARRVTYGGDAYLPGLRSLIVRSPFLASVQYGTGLTSAMLDDAPQVTMIFDGRETARADLLRYLEGNVRDVEGTIHLRMRGPLLGMVVYGSGTYTMPTLDTWCSSIPTRATAPWRIAEKTRFWARRPNDSHAGNWVPVRGLATYPKPTRENLDDIAHFICTCPGETISLARSILKEAGGKEGTDGVREAVALMAPLYRRGIVGGIAESEFTAAADSIASAADALHAYWRAAGFGNLQDADRYRAYAREYVMPALDAAPSEEDEAALSGMAPG